MPSYLLSWTVAAERLLDISVRFTAPADQPRLLLPAWRPGRYLIQNYAANVREWLCDERRTWKDGKSSWRVDARAGDEVTFRYRYYAGVLDAGSSFLDDDEVYVNGSNLFMMIEGLHGEEHLLTIAAPADWLIETQLPHDEEQATRFRARDYDHLIDSPFIASPRMTRHSFVEHDARFHLVFRGDEGLDTGQYVEPLRAVARTQAQLFGGAFPFSEYRFLFHVRDRWHGVEHENSSSIILRRASLLGTVQSDESDRTVSISSHELFHAWNVKRILPAAFHPYDYGQEAPTRLLWAMEGLTSYYGDLSIERAGVWSVSRYLDHLAGEIATLEALPARHFLSLAQAGFDAWLSDPAQMHDAPNAYFSFYNKGELVAALLDLTIRSTTNGERSLDDVLAILWREYGQAGRGLEEDAMERVVARVADAGDFFARYVDGTEPLPYADCLAPFGIELSVHVRNPEQTSLGARVRASGQSLVVDAVVRGAAGMDAGLLPNDELLAIDGYRVASEAALETALRAVKIGDTAGLLIARGFTTKTLTLTGRPDPRPQVALRVERPSDLRRGWLWRDE